MVHRFRPLELHPVACAGDDVKARVWRGGADMRDAFLMRRVDHRIVLAEKYLERTSDTPQIREQIVASTDTLAHYARAQ